ncbi:MAG: flippase-like domain-containing protein [Deltaproteobacteria bacterium]|nr:flippase-like domain-containing protein [Deltaproteobacteria bacterium]
MSRPESPRAPWWRRALLLVGFASAAWVLTRLDLAAMMDALARVSLTSIVAATAAMWLNMALKAVRWQRMLRHRGADVPASLTAPVFFEAMLWGSLTIGRAGELFRVTPLVDRGVPLRVALASVLLDRALDLGFLVVVGAAALLAATDHAALAWAVGGATLALLVFMGALGRQQRIDDAPPPGRVRLALEETRAFFYPSALLESGLWTVASWAASFCIVLVLGADLSPEAGAVRLLAAAFIASLSTLLPITYQGVGTREPIFAAVLAADGVDSERAVLLALLVFTLNLVPVLALGAAAGVWRRRRAGGGSG